MTVQDASRDGARLRGRLERVPEKGSRLGAKEETALPACFNDSTVEFDSQFLPVRDVDLPGVLGTK